MIRPDMRTRQARAAQQHMRANGYQDAQPTEIQQVEDDTCWYFYYDFPDGPVELEVVWDTEKYTWSFSLDRIGASV